MNKIFNIVITSILVIVTISTIYSIIVPLFPTASEYEGSFPEKFWENFDKWVREIIFRHLVLFNQFYSVSWILLVLSNVFLLLLVKTIRKDLPGLLKKDPKELPEYYLSWAVSSLLITIVFITKWVTPENVTQVGLGVLGLAISIIVLLYARPLMKK